MIAVQSMLEPAFQEEKGAAFSPCRRYRYRLWRKWNPSKESACFVLLNPSTADEKENDPTVERCQRRAVQMGFGGIEVVNIFAFRATDPAVMKNAEHPIGEDNDAAIIDAAVGSGMIICGWGEHGAHLGRGVDVLTLLLHAPITASRLYHLGRNASGQPRHPLYVPYSVKPMRFA